MSSNALEYRMGKGEPAFFYDYDFALAKLAIHVYGLIVSTAEKA